MCRRVRLTVRLGGSAATDPRKTADEVRENREITEGIVAGMMSFRWPVTQARASVRRPHPPTAAVTAPGKTVRIDSIRRKRCHGERKQRAARRGSQCHRRLPKRELAGSLVEASKRDGTTGSRDEEARTQLWASLTRRSRAADFMRRKQRSGCASHWCGNERRGNHRQPPG
jgi:hypothetical protein